ncbi:MAG: OmpA family protein [Polyangiaceae bacterium]
MYVKGSRPGWLLVFALTTLALSSWSEDVQAQDFALDRFEPAPVGQTGFASVEPQVVGVLRPSFGLTLSYARRPLELVSRDETVGLVVDHQLQLHLGAALSLFDRVEVDVDAPATLSQGGEDPALGAQALSSPEGASFNDVRLGAKVALFSDPKSPFAAALGLRAWLPSGNQDAFAGSGELRYEPYVSVGARHERIRWALNVGRRRQPEGSGLQQATGSEFTARAGAWWVAERWSAGPELLFATSANGRTDAFSSSGTAMEALIGGHFSVIEDLDVGAALGPGLTRGVGTPKYRALLSLSFSPGRAAAEEAWKRRGEEPATSAGGAHIPEEPGEDEAARDRDLDGLVDGEDACPDVPGEREPKGAKPGCPPDRDLDTIIDGDDACPDQAGVSSLDPQKHGCPSDKDGDGFIDSLDGCPEEAGPDNADPKLRGCPPSVRLEGKQIVILDQVRFQTGSHVILAESNDLLSQVAAVLNGHPEITRVAIDGHTDNVGQLKKNLALSRRRAASVLRWLVDHGVDERRLEARGFGPRRPIAPNTTPEGRAKNRRVEFQILKRSPSGESDWKDGDIDAGEPAAAPAAPKAKK